jgi:hypothetical protein
MPFTVEEFNRQLVEEILRDLPMEKRLQMVKELPAEQLLESVPVEKRLESVPVEKRVEGMSADELLKALTPEVLAALRRRLQDDSASGSS